MQNVDFFDFFRSSLFRSKKYSFLSRISKNLSFWLFWLKKKPEKKVDFLDKNHGLTPLQNGDFFWLCENFTFEVQRTFFLSRISKNVSLWHFLLKKKKHMKKSRFFDKNHGLTPLQNVDFFDLFRTSLFRSKKLYFLSRISKNLSFWLFWNNKRIKKKIFWQKQWTNPFAKCRFFFDFVRTSLLGSKKLYFQSRISKNVSFWLFFC